MSQKGIDLFAGLLSTIQQAKNTLLEIATKEQSVDTAASQQDIRLGHLCTKMNDAVKDEFMKVLEMTVKKK